MSSIVRFAGRRFTYEGMESKPVRGYPGYVAMVPVEGGAPVRARADMVTLETPNELLAHMRERAGSAVPVNWAAVRRVTALPLSERSEADQALVDAYGDH